MNSHFHIWLFPQPGSTPGIALRGSWRRKLFLPSTSKMTSSSTGAAAPKTRNATHQGGGDLYLLRDASQQIVSAVRRFHREPVLLGKGQMLTKTLTDTQWSQSPGRFSLFISNTSRFPI